MIKEHSKNQEQFYLQWILNILDRQTQYFHGHYDNEMDLSIPYITIKAIGWNDV